MLDFSKCSLKICIFQITETLANIFYCCQFTNYCLYGRLLCKHINQLPFCNKNLKDHHFKKHFFHCIVRNVFFSTGSLIALGGEKKSILHTSRHQLQYSPETVAVVELAVHQKPLHQVDMFLAGGAGAAERVALDRCNGFHTCLRGLARLMQATGTLFAGRGQGGDVRGRGEDGE